MFLQDKFIFSYYTLSTLSCAHDIVLDIKHYIMRLLINLCDNPVKIQTNVEGFTIKNHGDVLIFTESPKQIYRKFDLVPYNFGVNPKLFKLSTEKFKECKRDSHGAIKYCDIDVKTVGLIKNAISIHCIIAESKNAKIYVSEYLENGSVWCHYNNAPMIGQMTNLVKMKFHKGGKVVSYSCARDAFFVIVDKKLFVTGIIAGNITHIPTIVEFPQGEFVIAIDCALTYAFALTNKGNVYSVQTSNGLQVKKIDLHAGIISMCIYCLTLYILTSNGCMLTYNIRESHIVMPLTLLDIPEKINKICCTITKIFVVTRGGKIFSTMNLPQTIIPMQFKQLPFENVQHVTTNNNEIIIATENEVYYASCAHEFEKLCDV